MTDSILLSTKKYLGIAEAYEAFDPDIIMFINSALFVLEQAGIGEDGFMIEDDLATWDEYLPDVAMYAAVKNYVWLYVKMQFDPPSSGTVIEKYKEKMDELIYRLNVRAEFRKDLPKEDTEDDY